MRGRPSILLLGLLWVASLHADAAGQPNAPSILAADPLPNIILMMGDDHGWEETGYHGHPHVRTPVLDEMAAAGLRFDRF